MTASGVRARREASHTLGVREHVRSRHGFSSSSLDLSSNIDEDVEALLAELLLLPLVVGPGTVAGWQRRRRRQRRRELSDGHDAPRRVASI